MDCKSGEHFCSKAQQLVKFTERKSQWEILHPGNSSQEILVEGAVVFSNVRSLSQKVLEFKERWYEALSQ
jgi:hypothetical protein